MREKLILFLLLFNCSLTCKAQSMQWQRAFGGSGDDIGNSVICLDSGELVVCGLSASNDGDIYFHNIPYVLNDVLVLKSDSNGNIYWNNCYGGTSGDDGIQIIPTKESNFFIGANTNSTNGDVTGIHNHGQDFWLAKLNSQNLIIWENCFGSFNQEYIHSVIQTKDSGFVALGETYGNDGDVNGNHGLGHTDIWVVKVDKNGTLLWQVCLGSWTFDAAGSLVETSDNGILVVGSAITGQGGSVQCSSSILGENVWIVKLDSSGNQLWDRCYGGLANDEGEKVVLSPNGGYYVLGYASSGTGDVSGYIGTVDFWLLRLDDSGNLLWQKCFGGTGFDIPHSIALAPNGDIIMCGSTDSFDGQAASNHGGDDVFIVRADSSGNYLWSHCYGGSDSDIGYSVAVATDGSPIFTGFTESNDGDVSGNHGGRDLWLVKLNEIPISIYEIENPISELKVSIVNNQLNIVIQSAISDTYKLVLYDLDGKELMERSCICNKGINKYSFEVNLKSGFKILQIQGTNSNRTIKFFVD